MKGGRGRNGCGGVKVKQVVMEVVGMVTSVLMMVAIVMVALREIILG